MGQPKFIRFEHHIKAVENSAHSAVILRRDRPEVETQSVLVAGEICRQPVATRYPHPLAEEKEPRRTQVLQKTTTYRLNPDLDRI